MSAEFSAKAKEISAGVGARLWRFLLNSGRRGLILVRWLGVLWQQRRLNRAWRRLGKEVHLALEAGEINPMLTEPVRDAVLRSRDLKAAQDRQRQAIAALRAKIRESRGLPPEPEEKPTVLDTAARGE
ncbi:MAG: hypothetical protein K6T55_07790 [Syntrophobacterales bacterium]|nr:hypothetical protein [Syntrophobacterales bacterium]